MDAASFFIALADSLGWPATIIVLAVLFRRDLGHLLARIRRGKIGNAELEFSTEIRKVTEMLSASAVNRVKTGRSGKHMGMTFNEMKADPRSAILQLWTDVEDSAWRRAQVENLAKEDTHGTFGDLVTALKGAHLLNEEEQSALAHLRALRNKVAGNPDFVPPIDDLLPYIAASTQMIARLEGHPTAQPIHSLRGGAA